MTNLTKARQYSELQQTLSALIANETNMIAILANTSALLYAKLPEVNWVGFYLLDKDQLVLGPFQGNIACMRIPIGKGVCGTAVVQKKIQRVDDVHQFDGHIACDSASNAEIVLPIIVNGRVIGVLDIDSPRYARFDSVDEHGLTMIVNTITECLLMVD